MKKLYFIFTLLLLGIMISKAGIQILPFPVTPIIPDSNTVLLDHFDSTTLGEIQDRAAYVSGPNGLSECVNFYSYNRYFIYQTTIDLEKSGTIEMWIYPNTNNKGLINIGNIFQIRLDSTGKIQLNVYGNLTKSLSGNTSVNLSSWNHVAVSWGDSTKIYLNGKLDMISAQQFRPDMSKSQTSIYVPDLDDNFNTYIHPFQSDYLNVDELHISKIQRTNTEIASRVRFNVVIKTIQLSAGTLSQLLTTKEKTTINSLVLSGTIDASDFKTMRDSMPSLCSIDMKDVSISAYNGKQGTGQSFNYPANTIPQYSFSKQNKLISVVLPNYITSIDESAFNGCSQLTYISLSNSITSIGNYVFAGCSYLRSVALPDSLRSIGNSVFASCYRLNNIALPGSLNSLGDDAFYECSALKSIIIPNSVTTMGKGVFKYCNQLSDVTLSNSLTSISDGAFEADRFYGFLELSGKFVIPNSVTSIGGGAFYRSGLSGNVIIPNSVTSIGGNAFGECYITSINIPNSVTLGDGAFFRCNGLKSFYAYPISPIYLRPIHANQYGGLFEEADISGCTLYVPYGSKSLYQNANQWKDFTRIVEMSPDGITELTDNDHFILYPNPATEGFYIDAVDNPAMISVYNLIGVQLLSKHVSNKSYVDMNGMPQGQYIVKITTAEGVIEKKLIKK